MIIPVSSQILKYYSEDIPVRDEAKNVAYLLYKLGIKKSTIQKWLKNRVHVPDKPSIYYDSREPEYTKEIKDTNKNVMWFLKHKRPIKFDNIAKNYMIELLSSQMSSKDITKKSSVPFNIITKLRNNKKSLYSLSYKNITKLCMLELRSKDWFSLQGFHMDLIDHGIKPSRQITGSNYKITFHFDNTYSRKPTARLTYKNKENIPKHILRICNTYADEPKYLNVNSDAILMDKDLNIKKQNIISLDAFGKSKKDICKELGLDKHFINLVLDNKFTDKINF